MERTLETLFRRGVVPFCCGGASICFGLYSYSAFIASAQWAKLDEEESILNDVDGKRFLRHAERLDRHAATCAAMSLASAAGAYEAVKDWRGYRSLASIDHVEDWLMKRRLFVLRVPVLAAMAASWVALEALYGGIQFTPPSSGPPIILANASEENNLSSESTG
jgi:hypothetical protein